MMKSNKGITLVALIITIIVLLILAGVSISLVVGDNGVMNQAQKASQRTDLASAQSALELTLSSITSDFLGNVWEENTSEKIFENVKVYDLDKELQNNGFYIVKFGGETNSGNKTALVGNDKDKDTSGTGTSESPILTTIVITEGTPGDGNHTNKNEKNKAKNTTYTATLEWTERSVRIKADSNGNKVTESHEFGTVESVSAS